MNDATITQLGLVVVYSAVGVLLNLTDRVERSRALRVWSLTFFLLAVDALVNVGRLQFGLPPAMCALS